MAIRSNRRGGLYHGLPEKRPRHGTLVLSGHPPALTAHRRTELFGAETFG